MYKIAATGAFSMAMVIVLGALSAHKLKGVLSTELLEAMETGLKYQMIHSIALLALPLLFFKLDISMSNWAWYLQMAGIVLFSFSLYILAIRHQIGIPNATWIGAITPLGGISFVLSWVLIGVKLLKIS